MLHPTLSPARAFSGIANRNRGYGFRAHRGACHRAVDASAPSGRAVLVCLTGKSPISLSSPVSKKCVRSTTTKCTRGRGCNGHPTFPMPSLRGSFMQELGRIAPRGRERAFRRRCERSEAIHSFFTRRDGLLRFARNDGAGDGLLRGACHRARIRATRWLAMTVSCDHRATLSGCHRPRRRLRIYLRPHPRVTASPLSLEELAKQASRRRVWDSRHCERSEAILSLRGEMDCFASLAMTARAMDCFAEPVIGRAFARPVGSQ